MRTGPVARPADAGCPMMTFSATSRSPRASCTARPITSDQPDRLPEGQGRGEAALALPQVAPLIHEVNDRLTSHSPKGAGDFFVVQKNTSSACSIAPVATMCSPSRRTQTRRMGHARVKSRACSSRMTAYR